MSVEASVLPTKGRKVIFALASVCLLLVVAIGAIATNKWFSLLVVTSSIESVAHLAPSVSAKTEAVIPQSLERGPDSKREVELVVISPTGFEPDIIRRKAGRVLLVVVNDSKRPLITLRAEAANGGLIRQIQMPSTKRRWELPVNLPRGRFQIVDTERPNNILRIETTE